MSARVAVTGFALVHARSVDEHGHIVPRCGFFKNAKRQADVTVTGDAQRVTCKRCREALS